MPDQRLGCFELKQKQIADRDVAKALIDVGGGEHFVRSRGDDDGVLAAAIDGDERASRLRTGDHPHVPCVDVLLSECARKQPAVGVVADGADDRRRRARPCRCDGLVRALTSGGHRGIGCQHRFTRRGQTGDVYAMVGIEAADDEHARSTVVIHGVVPSICR